jgi:hypothetical protein
MPNYYKNRNYCYDDEYTATCNPSYPEEACCDEEPEECPCCCDPASLINPTCPYRRDEDGDFLDCKLHNCMAYRDDGERCWCVMIEMHAGSPYKSLHPSVSLMLDEEEDW